MTRPHETPSWGQALLLGGLLTAFFAAAPAFAQDDEYIPEGEEQAAAEDEADFDTIDDLLAQDEEVLSGANTYAYDPGARRDPFMSLAQRRDVEDEGETIRPEGIPGLQIDEIEIQGLFQLGDGPVAQVISASEETSYLIRVGDELWDGDVVRITQDEVVFKQTVKDPTALKPFREVVKRLNP